MGGLLKTGSIIYIKKKKINPEKWQLRIGILYVQSSPVMASFLLRNFVWVEFLDIQRCLGFLNIWQIGATLQKVWPNFAAKHPEILAVASAHAQISCMGWCSKSSTSESHHIHCTQTTQGMLKYFYLESPEYNCDGHKWQGDRYEVNLWVKETERQNWSSQTTTPV